jgi:agmatine/peptidylarginine deiminase
MVTVHGAVTKVEDMRGVAGSNQMQIKTPQGDTWVVFLGPKWFVNNQRLKFNVGDLVDVKGAKYITMGQNNIVAQDVSKGDLTMKLRNADGLPSWECCIPRMPSQQAR